MLKALECFVAWNQPQKVRPIFSNLCFYIGISVQVTLAVLMRNPCRTIPEADGNVELDSAQERHIGELGSRDYSYGSSLTH